MLYWHLLLQKHRKALCNSRQHWREGQNLLVPVVRATPSMSVAQQVVQGRQPQGWEMGGGGNQAREIDGYANQTCTSDLAAEGLG